MSCFLCPMLELQSLGLRILGDEWGGLRLEGCLGENPEGLGLKHRIAVNHVNICCYIIQPKKET